MRPRVLSIVSNRKFDSHVTWLVDRLENDLGLDSQISECYARFVISSLIGQNGEIDPKREQELFVYDRPRLDFEKSDFLKTHFLVLTATKKIRLSIRGAPLKSLSVSSRP